MERTQASNLLAGCTNGTFLVRISMNATRMGEYSMSVVFNIPRHIRINRSSSPNGTCVYYLNQPQIFVSIWVSQQLQSLFIFPFLLDKLIGLNGSSVVKILRLSIETNPLSIYSRNLANLLKWLTGSIQWYGSTVYF